MERKPSGGECYFCRKHTDDDCYCPGCKEYICDGEECGGKFPFSLASATGHGHHPEDHRINAEADEELEAV